MIPVNWSASGASGHRGSPLRGSFTGAHILAITQAICDYRHAQGVDGPLYMGKDTHAVSGPAQRTALEVLAANGAQTIIQRDDGFTPTPSSAWTTSWLEDEDEPVKRSEINAAIRRAMELLEKTAGRSAALGALDCTGTTPNGRPRPLPARPPDGVGRDRFRLRRLRPTRPHPVLPSQRPSRATQTASHMRKSF